MFIGLYSFIAYYTAYRYHCSIRDYAKWIELENKSVLVINGVSRDKDWKTNEQDFLEKLAPLPEVAGIYVVPDFTKAYQLTLEKELNNEALEKYTILNESNEVDEREVIFSKLFTKKVDAVAFHTAENVRIDMELELAMDRG